MTEVREACAVQLDDLAADPTYAARSEDLRSIAASLRDQMEGEWTGIDMVSAFPPEASIDIAHRRQGERILGGFAAFMVFVPVAWTWYSLRSATNAYDDYLQSHTTDETVGQTFLGLWTTGFEGRLADWHRFGSMALVSLLLIGLAALMIVMHRAVAERNMAEDDRAAHDAQRRLVIALVGAQRLLNERRTDDPKFLENAIKRSVAELIKAQEATQRGVAELSAASTKAVGDVAAAGTKSAEGIAAAWGKAVADLGVATGEAVTDLASVSDGIFEQLEPVLSATAKAGEQLTESAASVRVAQAQITAATSDIQTQVLTSLTAFASSLSSTQSELNTQVTAAVSSLNATIGQAESAREVWSRGLSDGFTGSSKAVQDVAASTTELVDLLREHKATLQAQSNDLGRAADLAGQLLIELRERAEAAGNGF